MRKMLLVAALAASFAVPAFAKNFAVPSNNPAATIAIPDDWKTRSIDYGFSARPQDESVVFYAESTDAKGLDKMMALNESWMKENKIKPKGKPVEQDFEMGGLKASLLRYAAEDEDGETIVDFVFVQVSGNRLVMFTLWGSDEDRTKHADEIKGIQRSIKAIN